MINTFHRLRDLVERRVGPKDLRVEYFNLESRGVPHDSISLVVDMTSVYPKPRKNETLPDLEGCPGMQRISRLLEGISEDLASLGITQAPNGELYGQGLYFITEINIEERMALVYASPVVPNRLGPGSVRPSEILRLASTPATGYEEETSEELSDTPSTIHTARRLPGGNTESMDDP